MNAPARRTTLGLLLLAACAPAGAGAQYLGPLELDEISLSGRTPESIILTWPAFSYRLSRLMISKYGQPSEATDHRLVWRDKGPWKWTAVYRIAPGGRLPWKNRGRLEQSVAYRVPAGKLGDLARFDPDIEADAEEGLLTARSDEESANYLALNLADEVLRGRRTPQEAHNFRESVTRQQDTGKSSPYLERLLFVPGGSPANEESPD